VIFVAIVIAVGELCSDFPQVACSDRLIARHTEGLSAGRALIHQYKSHVASPNAKQNTVSAAWTAVRRRLEVDVATGGRPPDGP
jgi:hypothetical protein